METVDELIASSTEVIVDASYEEEDDPKPRSVIINGKEYKPWMFKPGQSGNPKGRPKGKTLKEWARDYLACMTDDERNTFLAGLPKDVIWRMAEGNPTEDRNVSITVPKPILGGMTQATVIEEQSTNALPEGQNIENKP